MNCRTLHRRYRLYYILAVLHGSRKQLFVTFAPWVLVTIFNQPTELLAKLLLIGGIVWSAFGFQYVFLMGAGLALVNLVAALQVRVPDEGAAV